MKILSEQWKLYIIILKKAKIPVAVLLISGRPMIIDKALPKSDAFMVAFLPGTEGLVHISQLANERVNRVTDVLHEGEEVLVKVLEIDKQGKIRLSRKDALGANIS